LCLPTPLVKKSFFGTMLFPNFYVASVVFEWRSLMGFPERVYLILAVSEPFWDKFIRCSYRRLVAGIFCPFLHIKRRAYTCALSRENWVHGGRNFTGQTTFE
jgi:hypothetical protein